MSLSTFVIMLEDDRGLQQCIINADSEDEARGFLKEDILVPYVVKDVWEIPRNHKGVLSWKPIRKKVGE